MTLKKWFLESVSRNGKASPTRITIFIAFAIMVTDVPMFYLFNRHMPESMFYTFAGIVTSGLFANKIPTSTDKDPEVKQ